MRHLIDATRHAISNSNYYAALATAMVLPDICGWILDPQAGSRARYSDWFDLFMKHHYTSRIGAFYQEYTFLTGNDFYALRCAYLHEGRDDISDQRAQEILTKFQFVVAPHGAYIHRNQIDNLLQLQLDVFCNEILEGVEMFLTHITGNSAAEARLGSMLTIRQIDGTPV